MCSFIQEVQRFKASDFHLNPKRFPVNYLEKPIILERSKNAGHGDRGKIYPLDQTSLTLNLER
jgi:hypothetical protein